MIAASYFMLSSKISFLKEFSRMFLVTMQGPFDTGKKGSYPNAFKTLEVSVRMVLSF